MLVAASESLSGSWVPRAPFGADSNGALQLTPIAGTKRGTFRTSCPGGCIVDAGKDGGSPESFAFDRGEYEVLGFTNKGLVHGAFFTDDFTVRFTFEFGSNNAMRSNQISIDFAVVSLPFDRATSGAVPGP
jgi:hypothetical protein